MPHVRMVETGFFICREPGSIKKNNSYFSNLKVNMRKVFKGRSNFKVKVRRQQILVQG